MKIYAQHRIYACFFLFGVALGACLSRLPDLQEKLGITHGELGLTLIGMSIGSLISLTFSAPLLDRLGAQVTCLVTVLGTALLFALIPFMPVAQGVFAVLFGVGLLAGAMEIKVNVETDRLEAQYNRAFMSRAHGFWSLGFFVTALVAAGVRQLGIAMEWHLAGAALFVLAVGLFMILGMTDAPKRPSGHQGKTPLIAFPTWGLLPLCIIGMAAFLIEGAGVDWSAVYMRYVFAVAPLIGGLGLTLFTFCMAMARLFVGPVVEKAGPRFVATAMLAIAAVGALLVSLAPMPWVALVGFGMLGAGCSAVYPLAVSAAAQRTDRPSAVNVAALGQISFVVFFLAPPLLGFVAQYFGIRSSYLVILPIIALGLLFARSLPARGMAAHPADVPAQAQA